MEKTCEQCAQTFVSKGRSVRERVKQRYCSRSCASKSKMTPIGKVCVQCKTAFTGSPVQTTCSAHCLYLQKKQRRQRQLPEKVCPHCGVAFRSHMKRQECCSYECAGRLRWVRHPEWVEPTKERWRETRARPEVQAKVHAHLHSDRNPFRDPAVRAKSLLAARKRGWDHLNGGNGQPASIPQQLLAAALGWSMEVIVPTREGRQSGYPTCYKIDVAEPSLKVGIEVDGDGHKGKKARLRDQKKTDLLEALGWRIMRVSNTEVLNNLREVLLRIASIT